MRNLKVAMYFISSKYVLYIFTLYFIYSKYSKAFIREPLKNNDLKHYRHDTHPCQHVIGTFH